MVDLDYVRRSDPALRRGGVGDVVSNLSAIADWRLAERVRGEEVDGVAVTFARTAATSIVHREDGIDDDEFLIALAEALVLSGLAMATAGSSRPCSGGDHEILHAIDHLFPGTAAHGELAGAASLFTAYLRDEDGLAAGLSACLARHGLPRTPAHLGLTEQQFAQAVVHAPLTRPDRDHQPRHAVGRDPRRDQQPGEVRRRAPHVEPAGPVLAAVAREDRGGLRAHPQLGDRRHR